MNNLISTEKALKHWLKNKVAVTTATVVGFLIMGTVSFGVENDEILNTNGETVIVNNNYKIEKGKKVEVSKDNAIAIEASGKFNIENDGSIIAKGGNKANTAINVTNVADNSFITNNGLISAQVQDGGSASAINVGGTIAKGKTLTITNSATGTIESKRDGISEGIGGRAAINVSSTGGQVIIKNDGTIKVNRGTAIYTNSSGTVVNNGTIELSGNSLAVRNDGGNVTNTNNGIIKITDKTKAELEKENFDSNSLFVGATKVENKGMITDNTGNALHNSNNVYLSGNLTTQIINNNGKETGAVTLGGVNDTKISSGSSEAIQLDALNIVGKVGILTEKNDNQKTIEIKNTNINLDKNGIFSVGNLVSDWDYTQNKEIKKEISGILLIEGKKLNKETNKDNNKYAVELLHGSKLVLKDVNFNGGITSDNSKTHIDVLGNTFIDGEINVTGINIGDDNNNTNGILTLASSSKFTNETLINNEKNGLTIFKIAADQTNAIGNSDKKLTISGNIDFDISLFTQDTTITISQGMDHDFTNAIYGNEKGEKTGIYNTKLDKVNGDLIIAYNRSLFADARLNEINNAAQIVNDKFSNDISIREGQMDKIYSGSIYAETIRAAYDNLKLNEGTILSLSNNVKAGEFTAEGRAIYNKDEYKRDGIVGKYDVENETSGLLASLEYGVNDTTKTGLVFAGSKQDLDVTGGKADGDLFYLGFYGVKSLGNYDLTAGLGYQLGKYDATNTAANVVGKDKYDTKALSGYVQAKYLGDLGDGLSIQPKVKLGYTHLKQDSAKDSYFGLTDTDVTTFDTELGADLVKTVQLEKSKVDVKFGTAFVKTFGDTDKEFKGQFFGANTASNQFGVHGGELSENVLKFNLGAEVANENGFFYNGGFTYEFGSEDMKSYGVNVGAGYRF